MISHLIFLTREERYALIAGEDVSVIGVNMPVWLDGRHTSEPAQEVFCRYLLMNREDGNRVALMPDGYAINLPQEHESPVPELTNDQWRLMTREQQERFYEKFKPLPTAKNLRDIKDGGGEYLKFHYISLTKEQKTVHNFEIKTMESLEASLS